MALHLKIQEVMAVPRWMTREEQEALHLKNLEEPAALLGVGIADGDVTGAARTDPMGQF